MRSIKSRKWLLLCKCSLAIVVMVVVACEQYDKDSLQISAYQYPAIATADCQAEMLEGKPGAIDGLSTETGIRYNVRTPSNYDSSVAHPLLMVYAPAARSGLSVERFTGLTKMATSIGFVVAYVDSKRLSLDIIKQFGTIPRLVAQKWCINEKRIFLTGHSDGGTVTSALAFLEESRNMPAAIAPSAAGISGVEIAENSCPKPISVMVMHNAGDTHFPGFGAETVGWWAQCNQCDLNPSPQANNGCVTYDNCANDVTTLYCELPGSHADWPKLNPQLLGFFSAQSVQ